MFCTHLSNQYVGVAAIEGTRPLIEVATLDPEITYLLLLWCSQPERHPTLSSAGKWMFSSL